MREDIDGIALIPGTLFEINSVRVHLPREIGRQDIIAQLTQK